MDPRFSPQQQQRFVSHSSQDQGREGQRNRKLFIERNSQQEQQIVIPYWDEESSSAHYHLIEEIRLLKKKNLHFQSHMGRMKLEYEQLRLNLEQMDENQKQHIRRHAELSQRYNIAITKIQQLKGQLQILKHQNQDLISDLKTKDLRDQQNRKKIIRLKDQEALLNSKMLQLQQQLRLLKLKNQQQKKILERSHQRQLNLFKQNCQQNHQKGQQQSIITELKVSLKQKNGIISRLEENHKIMLQKYEKIQKQLQNKSKQAKVVSFQAGEQLQKQREKNRELFNRLKDEIDRYKKQNKKLEDDKDKNRNQILRLQQSLKQALSQLSKNKDKKFQGRKCSTVQISIKGNSNEKGYQKQIVNLKNQLDVSNQKQLQKGERIKQIQEENLRLNTQLKKLQYLIKDKQDQKNNDDEIIRLKQEISQQGSQLARLNKTVKQLEEQIRQKSKQKQQAILKLQVTIKIQKQKIESKQEQLLNLGQQLQKTKKMQQKWEKNVQKQPKKQQADDRTLEQLQAQYNSQMQALRRLVLYKKYPTTSNSELQSRLRAEYKQKFDILVFDYQQLQKQLLILQQQLLISQHSQANANSKQLVTFRTSEEKRVLYVQAIRKWEIAYEQLHAIYEAKLISKDEEINLLNLKLANMC